MFGQKKKEEKVDPLTVEIESLKSSNNNLLRMQKDLEEKIEKRLSEVETKHFDKQPIDIEPYLAPYAQAINDLLSRVLELENHLGEKESKPKKNLDKISAEEALSQLIEFITELNTRVGKDAKK